MLPIGGSFVMKNRASKISLTDVQMLMGRTFQNTKEKAHRRIQRVKVVFILSDKGPC